MLEQGNGINKFEEVFASSRQFLLQSKGKLSIILHKSLRSVHEVIAVIQSINFLITNMQTKIFHFFIYHQFSLHSSSFT